MQGLPVNLLTQNAAANAVKTDGTQSVGVNGKIQETKGEASAEGKGAFASLFASLLGGGETKAAEGGEVVSIDGKTAANGANPEVKTTNAAESKVDVFLKSKDQEQNKKSNVQVLSTTAALSPEVLKNIDNLLVKTETPAASPATEIKVEGPVSEKVSSTTNGLEELLKTLKNNEGVEMPQGPLTADQSKNSKEAKKNTTGTPLDFLLKESKGTQVAQADEKVLKTDSSAVSKLGVSSEDFLSQLKRSETPANAKLALQVDMSGSVDPKDLVQKQMNQSMKAYGQKQNLLNDNIIKSTKDLAFKDGKSKINSDELTTPDMKIGAELGMIKEHFIPGMQKAENGANAEAQASGKVLDLSKINTSNTNEIIKRISDYVEQNQVANKESLDLTVKHDSLGHFKIQVNRPMGPQAQQMDMQITTSTAEGHDFFMKNEIGLMKNLSQAGIHLSDLRIVSGGEAMSFSQSDSRQSGNSAQYGQAPKEFMSFENGDSSQGSQRRRELWQEARNNQQRYGA